MKSLLILFLFALTISSCAVTKYPYRGAYGGVYKYQYELIKPNQDTSRYYKDDKISIKFNVRISELSFMLSNNSNETMKINWDDLSLVVNGVADKVTHRGIRYLEKAALQPPTSIPPGASIDDFVLPINKAKFTAYQKWVHEDLFPIEDSYKADIRKSILNNKGSEFSLYFPLEFGGKVTEYTFVFRIKDVIPVNKIAKAAKYAK